MMEKQIPFSAEALTKSVYCYRKTFKQKSKIKTQRSQCLTFVWIRTFFSSYFHTYNFPSVMAPLRNVVGLDQGFSLCGHFVLCWFVFMWFEAAVMLKHSHYFCEHQRKSCQLRKFSCVSKQHTRPQTLTGHQTPSGPGPEDSVWIWPVLLHNVPQKSLQSFILSV